MPLVREFDPHAVVADILTVAGGLAAEMEERPWATLIPHVLPTGEPGLPPYSVGARLPRTRLGASAVGAARPLLARGEERGRARAERRAAARGPSDRSSTRTAGSRAQLALVATFPQLEYPRHDRGPAVRVTGPLLWEQPSARWSSRPATTRWCWWRRAPRRTRASAMLRGGARGPRRRAGAGAGTTNRATAPRPCRCPRTPAWSTGSPTRRTMPRCAAVVCHAGHGTVARALASGVPVIGCPAAGDMAENAARLPGPAAGSRCRGGSSRARGIRLAVRKLLARAGLRGAGAATCGVDASATTAARWRRRPWSAWPPESSGGGTRTHNLSVNSRSLCRLSYPGSGGAR